MPQTGNIDIAGSKHHLTKHTSSAHFKHCSFQKILVHVQDSVNDADQTVSAGDIAARKALFAQLPWEEIAHLETASIRSDVQMPLVQFLKKVAIQASFGNADAIDLMQSTVTVSCSACCLYGELWASTWAKALFDIIC